MMLSSYASGIIPRYCVPAQILMRFMAKAWQLDLDEVVCEFAQDHDHKFLVCARCEL